MSPSMYYVGLTLTTLKSVSDFTVMANRRLFWCDFQAEKQGKCINFKGVWFWRGLFFKKTRL